MLSTYYIIYISHFLSSWGDRMWHFAIPLFLFDLDPQSLTLSAVYGLTLSSSVLLFGPLIGDWIDRQPRLYSVRVTLFIQNSAVVLCATTLLLTRKYADETANYILAINIGVICLGTIAQLASVGTSIIIQKDWIVVVAGENKEILANLNSMTRRIDLVTKILSPVACGQIMAVATLSGGAIFIMSWNAVSMFLEYILLRIVYKRTPALSKKKTLPDKLEKTDEELKVLHSSNNWTDKAIKVSTEDLDSITKDKDSENKVQASESSKIDNVIVQKTVPSWKKIFRFAFTLKDGWKLFISQPIALPCIGFSFLYMTIIGFGYITTAYAYSQCLSELTVGLLQAGAAITGIIATYMYPPMRRKFGLVKTGIFNAILQILSLVPCIVSVFLMGSPFFLLTENKTDFMATFATESSLTFVNVSLETTPPSTSNLTVTTLDSTSNNTENLFIKCLENIEIPSSFLSMSFLMSGIILGRVGLWGFDLTITQMIQEHVVEKERGIFNGVQTSLNNFMDLLRFIFVLFLPLPSQFGILIFVSSTFVSIGYGLYFIYAKKYFSSFHQQEISTK